MSDRLNKFSRVSATCELGHEVEVFIADGIVTSSIHRDPVPVLDPVSGESRQERCPACIATANRLIHAQPQPGSARAIAA